MTRTIGTASIGAAALLAGGCGVLEPKLPAAAPAIPSEWPLPANTATPAAGPAGAAATADIGWRDFRLLPGGMRLLAVAGGMLMHARIWMGMQRFWTTLGEDPALAVALLEKLQALQIVAIDQATDCPALGAYLLDDDLAHCGGLLEGPKFLRSHVFPCYKQVGDILHSKGLPFIMHTDGRINQIIPDLIACGLDALHPIEPKAMDIAAIKQQYGDRLALLGNIDVDLLSCGALLTKFDTDVEARIRQVGPGGGYAIGSSNSVPDYVSLENYRALIEAALEFGRYPFV